MSKIQEVPIDEFLDIIETLGISETEAHPFAATSRRQLTRWKNKGKMPLDNFWAFQNQLTIYSVKELIKKLVVLRIIDKEFLKEMIDE
jgi:hypothetical protein